MPKPKPDAFGRNRVLDHDTGHQFSVPAAAVAHGNFTVLDEPASDVAGDALPVEYGVHKPAPTGYEAQTVDELKAEIAGRNDGRDPEGDTGIKVEAPGNKPELIAALEADDTRESLSSNPDGPEADLNKENDHG